MPSGTRSVKPAECRLRHCHAFAERMNLVAICYGFTGTPSPGNTWAAGIAATRRPGSRSLDPRMPEPITTEPVFATASSTSTGQSGGSPTGVIPPYSIPVAAVTASTGANDAFRASRCLRTMPFTSARVVARIMQAAYIVFPPRLPATTTQFADSSGETPYRSQNAAVSARAGSISATRTSSAPGHSRSAAATGAASNSGWDSAGLNDSTSLISPIQPDAVPPPPRPAPAAPPLPHDPHLPQPGAPLSTNGCHFLPGRAVTLSQLLVPAPSRAGGR